jgi:hypothetical protein
MEAISSSAAPATMLTLTEVRWVTSETAPDR